MTITEQLQFSVLTAPVASLDRRALSQAWYSALYAGNAPKAASGTSAAARALCVTADQPHLPLPSARIAAPRTTPAHTASIKSPAAAQGVPAERRAPRSALARKIERVFLKPRGTARKDSFTVEGENGRVHVLLQSRGTQFKLVAICPPKARAHVSAALAQARYALALRGIDLDADARSAQAC